MNPSIECNLVDLVPYGAPHPTFALVLPDSVPLFTALISPKHVRIAAPLPKNHAGFRPTAHQPSA